MDSWKFYVIWEINFDEYNDKLVHIDVNDVLISIKTDYRGNIVVSNFHIHLIYLGDYCKQI